MSKSNYEFIKALNDLKYENDIIEKIYFDEIESNVYNEIMLKNEELPEGIYNDDRGFYKIECSLEKEDIDTYISLKKIKLLRTIKNCAVYFTILSILGFIIFFIMILNA